MTPDSVTSAAPSRPLAGYDGRIRIVLFHFFCFTLSFLLDSMSISVYVPVTVILLFLFLFPYFFPWTHFFCFVVSFHGHLFWWRGRHHKRGGHMEYTVLTSFPTSHNTSGDNSSFVYVI